MGIAYRSDKSAGCTFAVWDGEICGDDITQHLIRLAEDPEFPPGQLQLTDVTTMERVSAPDPELIALLYGATDLAGRMEVALVVRASSFDYDDERYRSAASTIAIVLFSDLARACEHLGITTELAETVCDTLRRELRCG